MSDDASFSLDRASPTADDGFLIRFPPGLGLIPPRDVARPRIKGRMPTEWTA